MGSVRKLPNGKWQAQIRPEPGGRQITRTSDRQAVVKKWLDEQTATLVTGTYVEPRAGTRTLNAYYADWGERQLWEIGTREAMDLALRQCPFANRPMRAIKRSDVEVWVKSMDRAGLAPLTIRQRIDNVRRVLKAAVRDRVIASDPAEGVVLPRRRRREASMTVPTTEDVGALYAAAEPSFRPFIALCAFAGLRFGEANGVQLGDINFLRRTLAVRRQVQRRAPHPIEVRAPKYGSERTVHLGESLLQLLAEHVKILGTYGTDQWLLEGRDDGPAWPRRLQYLWDAATTSAGLELTAHSLRHFYASGLIAAGCDVVTVQRALGHASADITLRVYAHLWPDSNDRTRAAADALLIHSLRATDESVTNASAKSAS
jgi:integrase